MFILVNINIARQKDGQAGVGLPTFGDWRNGAQNEQTPYQTAGAPQQYGGYQQQS